MEKKHILLPIELEELEKLQRAWLKDELEKALGNISLTKPEAEEYLNAHEVADLLKCSVQNIYDHRNRGNLPAISFGSKVLFKRTDIDEFLSRCKDRKS